MKPEDGPWVSIPSKRYPDKVYYFNASTSISRWERPEQYCEPVDDSTTFQYFTKATTPEKTENRSYIVESLSPTCSPRKSEGASKSALESYGKKNVENKERKGTFHFHEKRNKVNNYLSTNEIKEKQVRDGFIEKNSKNLNDLKINTIISIPRYTKQAERSNYTSVPNRPSHCPDTSMQRSYISPPKYSSFERLKKLSYGDTSGYENYGQSYSMHSLKDRSDLSFIRGKICDAKIYGTASLRLEHLKKKLADERERKRQHSLLGKKCDLHPSNITRSDASYEFNPRRNTFVDDNIPIKTSEASGALDNEKKKSRNTSWEWNPPELVRDYNHKRIADCDETTNSTVVFDKYTTHAENTTNRYVRDELRKEKKTMGKINKPNAVQQNSNTTHLEHSDQYSKYERSVRSSNDNNKTSRTSRPKTDERLKQRMKLEHCFGYDKNKCISRDKHEVGVFTGPQSEKQLMENTDTNVKLIDIHPRNQSEERKSKNSAKQKLYGSKGGITKISRRVQKQLRTAVPKLVNLSSNLIQKNTECFSLKSENTSNVSCVSGHQFTDNEEMDWEPIEPEKVVMHVETMRREGSLQNKVNTELMNLCSANTTVSSEWFVVLDTNVLLSHLDFLHELLTIKDNELGMPTLFIPWVALQELDSLKSTNKQQALHHHARKAVNFLYHKLLSRHPRVQGQSKLEADEYSNLEPDDSILQCSLTLQKQSNKVLLLTNDHNLCNKGIVSGVESCSAAMLVQELEKRRESSLNRGLFRSDVNETNPSLDCIIDDTRQCIGMVLEEVLRTEMVLAYDRKWTEIVARKPPWNLDDIIFCLLKHWTAVFHLVLPSAGRELVEKIQCFIKSEKCTHSLKTVENLLKTCVSLMHLVSSLCYKQYVDDALDTLHRLQNSLKDQVSSSSMNDLPSQCPGSSIYSVKSRPDDTDSASSSSSHNTISSRASVPSTKCEQHSQIETSSADSKSFAGCDCSNSVGSKSIYDVHKAESDDDCLSLFASSFSEDVNNHSFDSNIERGKELSHCHLNKIWEKIAVYCGLLCDVMGIDPCVPYQRPEQFPSLEILHQNLLCFMKCIGSLLHCIEGILAVQPNELHESNVLILNFYKNIKEALAMWNEPAECLLPQHILAYCTQNDTREQLNCGRNQFQQFENILNQAVKFFLAQNKTTVF